MRKSRFSEEQMLGVLAGAELGSVDEVCRRHGVSPGMYYRWKSKHGGMSVPETRRLKQLEEENTRLKRIVADQALDNSIQKDLLKSYS
jgi:putative transposase